MPNLILDTFDILNLKSIFCICTCEETFSVFYYAFRSQMLIKIFGVYLREI